MTTECGKLRVAPGEIVVLPRNMRFSVTPAACADNAENGAYPVNMSENGASIPAYA